MTFTMCNTITEHNEQDQGFTLIEVVVTIALMLTLSVVGTVSYQSHKENAQQAVLESSANEVLTAVVAEDTIPNGDVENVLTSFNETADGVMVDITAANQNGLMIGAIRCDGGEASAGVSGNYSHLDTTEFQDVTYEWSTDHGNTVSVKNVCGEVVQTSIAQDPRAEQFHYGWYSNITSVWQVRKVTVDDHPLGISTAVESKRVDGGKYPNPESLSMYDIGTPPRQDRPFYVGVWVKSDTPGTAHIHRDHVVDLPANTWKFITSGDRKVGTSSNYSYAIAGVKVSHGTKEEIANATSWTTGAVISFDTPVTEYFDGDM